MTSASLHELFGWLLGPHRAEDARELAAFGTEFAGIAESPCEACFQERILSAVFELFGSFVEFSWAMSRFVH